MCDYCVEEEELPNYKQTCSICKVISDAPEILKTVKQQHTVSGLGQRGDSMINLTKEQQYVHLFCAFWFPEVEAADLTNFDQITGVDEIQAENFENRCALCGDARGAKLKCSDTNCFEYFHPICGKNRGVQHF